LFVEQAYDYMLNNPYRLRVLKLIEAGDHIEIENYTVKEEKPFHGASREYRTPAIPDSGTAGETSWLQHDCEMDGSKLPR
jgi:hypothetical protein